MRIDVEELQMFDGIASCANHIVNFKIGKLSSKLLFTLHFTIHNFITTILILLYDSFK